MEATLTIAELCLLSLVSALAYRIRGSSYFADWPKWFFGMARGDRLVKLLIGSLPVGVAILMAGGSLPFAIAGWFAVAILDTLPHGAFQGATSPLQVGGLCALGVASSLPVAALLHLWWIPAFGLLCGPAYLAGNRLPINLGTGDIALEKGPVNGEWFYGLTRTWFLFIVLLR